MGSVCRQLERESRGGKARVGLGEVTRVPQAGALVYRFAFLSAARGRFVPSGCSLASFGPFCLLPSFVTGGSGFY